MSDILPVGASRMVGRAELSSERSKEPRVDATSPVRRGDDRVDVSEMARMISKMNDMPSIRTELVSRVRAEIAAGTYDTDEKLNLALDVMMGEIDPTN